MSNLITKHIVSFSGGMGSFAEAKSCVDKYGKENVILLFSDTKTEDTDLYRFMDEVVAFLQCELIVLADGRTIWELFEDYKFVGNSRIDVCSSKLKRDLINSWILKNFGIKQKVYLKDENGNPLTTKTGRPKYRSQWLPDPNKPVEIHLGIDFSEHHRLTRCQERMAPWIYRSTLVEEGLIINKDFSEQFGIKRPFLYTLGFPHNNCFHGDEKFLTPEGNKSFIESVDTSVRVLGSRGNWKDATIKCFGKQLLVNLYLKKGNRTKIIKTTENHRWFLKNDKEIITSDLKEGDLLKNMKYSRPLNIRPSNIGIQHGITFGDGTYARDSWNNPAIVTLCGDKVELVKYFPLHEITEVKDVGVKVNNLPKYFKNIPNLTESVSYLIGFLMGYFSTDGSCDKYSASISSSKIEHLTKVQAICNMCGIVTYDIQSYDRYGYNDYLSTIHVLPIEMGSLWESFFIKDKHINYFKSRNQKYNIVKNWQVVKVEKTEEIDDVYCAVVPDGEAFTLEGNIFTGNCSGFCVKAGLGQFKMLYEKLPERYKYHEEKEEHLRHTCNTKPFLKKTVNGELKYLYMKDYREQYLETGKSEEDKFDIGGCACALPLD